MKLVDQVGCPDKLSTFVRKSENVLKKIFKIQKMKTKKDILRLQKFNYF